MSAAAVMDAATVSAMEAAADVAALAIGSMPVVPASVKAVAKATAPYAWVSIEAPTKRAIHKSAAG